jgi:hypothetical protein
VAPLSIEPSSGGQRSSEIFGSIPSAFDTIGVFLFSQRVSDLTTNEIAGFLILALLLALVLVFLLSK